MFPQLHFFTDDYNSKVTKKPSAFVYKRNKCYNFSDLQSQSLCECNVWRHSWKNQPATYLVKSSSPSMWRGTGEYLDGVTWGGGYTGLGSIAPM